MAIKITSPASYCNMLFVKWTVVLLMLHDEVHIYNTIAINILN